jgi:hypothetical protein
MNGRKLLKVAAWLLLGLTVMIVIVAALVTYYLNNLWKPPWR